MCARVYIVHRQTYTYVYIFTGERLDIHELECNEADLKELEEAELKALQVAELKELKVPERTEPNEEELRELRQSLGRGRVSGPPTRLQLYANSNI